MKAIGHYVLVEELSGDSVSEGGIYLSASDIKKMRFRHGRILSVGSLAEGLSVGDEIYYDLRAAHTMLVGGVAVTVIRSTDVVVVL